MLDPEKSKILVSCPYPNSENLSKKHPACPKFPKFVQIQGSVLPGLPKAQNLSESTDPASQTCKIFVNCRATKI
ncbi:hypothetical protein BDN70DRAFT_878982 [Pholiota conissans]|uniref:Uncharacterized protein n=1 Tax=Pholiota conissans TaxID=109636 RepID=A0A9P5Z0R9_9AGAR|nr:hypothetical protein BDN70DRAFT_878982 [Pholiota conissans]